MKMKLFNKDLKVPFRLSRDGNKIYLGYPSYEREYVGNSIFETTLMFTGFSRGRSSVKAEYATASGDRYEMFLSDVEVLLLKGINPNEVSGEFCFRKAGSNFGVVLLEDS